VPHDFDFLPSVTYNSPEVRFFVPIHPVQVYSAFLILLYLLGAWFLQRKRRTEGMIALIIFLIYAGGEFIIEFIRGDPVRLIFDYRINQLFDLLFIVIVIIFIIVRSHKKYLKINKIK
jgi:prolipoprotein diacylglyceryltransferase